MVTKVDMPPHSREAEQAVIGSVIRDNPTLDDVSLIIGEGDFYADPHQRIWRTITDLSRAGQPIDTVTLAEALKQRGWVEDVGGYPYIYELQDAAPTAANAIYYARIVRAESIKRQMLHAAKEIAQEAMHPTGPVDEALGQAEAKILAISQLGVAGRVQSGQELVHQVFNAYDLRHTRPGHCSGLASGISDLDFLTAGFQDGELTVIGARPSAGKTSFGVGVIRQVALRDGLPVLFFSLEQKAQEITERLICCEGSIDSHRCRRATLDADELKAFREAGVRVATAPYFVEDTAGQTMTRIAANARRAKRQHGTRLVIVDYLQLIAPEDTRVNRQEQVASISRRLKLLARELEVPVIAMAQLNRGPEESNRRPRLADLRESGAIEADADVVLLLDKQALRPIAGRDPKSCHQGLI